MKCEYFDTSEEAYKAAASLRKHGSQTEVRKHKDTLWEVQSWTYPDRLNYFPQVIKGNINEQA